MAIKAIQQLTSALVNNIDTLFLLIVVVIFIIIRSAAQQLLAVLGSNGMEASLIKQNVCSV